MENKEGTNKKTRRTRRKEAAGRRKREGERGMVFVEIFAEITSSEEGGGTSTAFLVITVLACVLLVCSLFAVGFLLWKRRKRDRGGSNVNDSRESRESAAVVELLVRCLSSSSS